MLDSFVTNDVLERAKMIIAIFTALYFLVGYIKQFDQELYAEQKDAFKGLFFIVLLSSSLGAVVENLIGMYYGDENITYWGITTLVFTGTFLGLLARSREKPVSSFMTVFGFVIFSIGAVWAILILDG